MIIPPAPEALARISLDIDQISSCNNNCLHGMPTFRTVFFRFCQRSSSQPKRPISTSPRMSSSGIAAALYEATVSPASITGAVPEEAKDKKHHLKNGKGFDNPWDSWRDFNGPAIGWAMVK